MTMNFRKSFFIESLISKSIYTGVITKYKKKALKIIKTLHGQI